MEPGKYDKDKRGEIPLLAQIFEEEKIVGNMQSEQMALESLLAGTGTEAPGQPRLSIRKMQLTIVGVSTATNGSIEQGGIISL